MEHKGHLKGRSRNVPSHGPEGERDEKHDNNWAVFMSTHFMFAPLFVIFYIVHWLTTVNWSTCRIKQMLSPPTKLIVCSFRSCWRLSTHHSLFDRRRFALIAGNQYKGQEAMHIGLAHTQREKDKHLSSVCLHYMSCNWLKLQASLIFRLPYHCTPCNTKYKSWISRMEVQCSFW